MTRNFGWQDVRSRDKEIVHKQIRSKAVDIPIIYTIERVLQNDGRARRLMRAASADWKTGRVWRTAGESVSRLRVICHV